MSICGVIVKWAMDLALMLVVLLLVLLLMVVIVLWVCLDLLGLVLFWLEFTLVEDGIEQGITDAVGGGIISVLGLLSQIYFLELYGLEKVLFIDEGLKEVSGYNSTGDINYLQNTLSFLKYLAENKGYMFVIITHDTYVKDIADVVYEVESGKVRKLK